MRLSDEIEGGEVSALRSPFSWNAFHDSFSLRDISNKTHITMCVVGRKQAIAKIFQGQRRELQIYDPLHRRRTLGGVAGDSGGLDGDLIGVKSVENWGREERVDLKSERTRYLFLHKNDTGSGDSTAYFEFLSASAFNALARSFSGSLANAFSASMLTFPHKEALASVSAFSTQYPACDFRMAAGNLLKTSFHVAMESIR